MFSTVIRHPQNLMAQAPVTFLQYLAALAIVEGIKTYDAGFSKMPIRLKWPNDICKSSMSDQITPLIFYKFLQTPSTQQTIRLLRLGAYW